MLGRVPNVPALDADHRAEVHRDVASLHSFVDLFERVHSVRWARLILLGCLNIADCATTLWFLSKGGVEANPLIAPFVHLWWGPLVVKCAIWLMVTRAVMRSPVRANKVDRLLVGAVAYYVVVVCWNLWVVAGLDG